MSKVITSNDAPRRVFHSLERKEAATMCSQACLPSTPYNEPNKSPENKLTQGLESWEGVSPPKSYPGSLLPAFQAPVASTTHHRRCGYRKPLHVIKHDAHSPLPPSSPPESPPVKNTVELLEDSLAAGGIDPFGFFAAEKRLK